MTTTPTAAAAPQEVTFYFDVSCPYAWVTSRWMVEVEKVRDVRVRWTPMSLSVLNEGRDELPENYRNMMKANWGPARVFTAVALNHPEKVGELYTVMGTAIHEGGQGGKTGFGAYNDIIAASLAQVGLPAELAAVADTHEVDEQLRAFQAQAMAKVGDEVGTPILQLGDVAFFGPVLTRVPRGEQAGTLFDGVMAVGSYPHFFELKRSRTESPSSTEASTV